MIGKAALAFVGIERDVRHRTLGRAYLLRLSQLIHIAREENGASGIIRISRESLSREPSNIRDKGWYRVLLPCASISGVPVVTLTGRPEETYPRNSGRQMPTAIQFVRGCVKHIPACRILPLMSIFREQSHVDTRTFWPKPRAFVKLRRPRRLLRIWTAAKDQGSLLRKLPSEHGSQLL